MFTLHKWMGRFLVLAFCLLAAPQFAQAHEQMPVASARAMPSAQISTPAFVAANSQQAVAAVFTPAAVTPTSENCTQKTCNQVHQCAGKNCQCSGGGCCPGFLKGIGASLPNFQPPVLAHLQFPLESEIADAGLSGRIKRPPRA